MANPAEDINNGIPTPEGMPAVGAGLNAAEAESMMAATQGAVDAKGGKKAVQALLDQLNQ
ncbi:hypothetical protein KBD59_02190 [Candidatus Gracilibacteria bacterium]|nr:hypothetical protein [Candidatus Gracilibacteria bacterium]